LSEAKSGNGLASGTANPDFAVAQSGLRLDPKGNDRQSERQTNRHML
jgi:hypothetical protein